MQNITTIDEEMLTFKAVLMNCM